MWRIPASFVFLLLVQSGEPHGILVTPKPRNGMGNAPGTKLQGFNNAITTANAGCGEQDNNDPGPQTVSLQYQPGDTVTISWMTTIPHETDRTNAGVRIAIKYSDGDSFSANVLANGVDAGSGENQLNSAEVTLPEEKECDNCVLQWMWAAQSDDGFYIGCADIQIGGTPAFAYKLASALFPASGDLPTGSIKFEQLTTGSAVKVIVDLTFTQWLEEHGYQVNEAPVNGECGSTGGEFTPAGGTGREAAGMLYLRHGEIEPDEAGNFKAEYEDSYISLNGALSIVDRSIVILSEDRSKWACATVIGEQFTPGEIAGIVIGCLVGCCLISACIALKFKASQQGKTMKEFVGMGGSTPGPPPAMAPNYDAAAPVAAAPPQPALGGLPPNWITQSDPGTGREYYVNTVTGESSWVVPTA